MSGIAQRVQRQVAGDGVQPATGGAALHVVAAGAGPDVDEGVMHDILGERPVADKSLCDPQEACAFVVVKSMQGCMVACGAGDQCSFVIKYGSVVRHVGQGIEEGT